MAKKSNINTMNLLMNESNNSSDTSLYVENEETKYKSTKNTICYNNFSNRKNVNDKSLIVTKKRKNRISVCLINCRYDVIRRTINKFGYKQVSEGENWNLYWTDLSITVERCKEMKRYQKINHFPGMLEICRKDLLARNLNKMLRLFPKDYNFFPRTWCFPADFGEALSYSRLRRNKTYIVKPEAGSQGRGIYITKSLQDIKPSEKSVCQVYISHPYLIDGYKFDLRIYTLLTSCDPLRIYVYNEGLVRFATSRYKEPTGHNINNVFMHLTNYAVNKYSRTYNENVENGSKRKLSWFKNYLNSLGYNADNIWCQINDIIIKTIISAYPILKHSYTACFPNHDIIPACCELLGIDIILDKKLNPQILEVNHSPSFHTDTALDREIKEALISDMFHMMNLDECDKRKIIREDRKRIRERLIHGIKENQVNNESKQLTDFYKHEMEYRGNFLLIYPVKSTEHLYTKYFDQGQGSLYSETAASRAREVAQNAIRDEMQLKAKLEASKRIATINKPTIPPQSQITTPPKKIESIAIRRISKFSTPTTIILPYKQNSFEPQMIVESEERDRLQRLAQREYLIRSHGILEFIYLSMKKNGNLRPREQRKFAVFDKLRNTNMFLPETDKGPGICDLLESL